MAEKRADTWRPSQEQELLVRAATGEGERACQAWQQWKSSVEVANLDAGSQRILPLLYRNLQRLGIKAPEMESMGQKYRRTWALNQVAMRHLEELLDTFEQHGIVTLVLKGAALLERYYKDWGTRPMADFDVLVPYAKTDEAMALLTEHGWQGAKPLHHLTNDRRVPFHGMGFFNEKKLMGCDLHWHIMHIHLSPFYDAPMWEAAVPLKIGKKQTLALCAEHQLIHLFFNGSVNEGNLNMRWLPDTLLVLKNEAAIDWAMLVAECQRLEFVQPVAAMLEYLRTTWEIPVPVEAIERLARTPVSYRMRKSYECLNTPKEQRSGMQVFWLLYTQYSISHSQASHFFPLGFLQFLGYRWGLDGLGSTLKYAYQRTRGVAAAKAKELA